MRCESHMSVEKRFVAHCRKCLLCEKVRCTLSKKGSFPTMCTLRHSEQEDQVVCACKWRGRLHNWLLPLHRRTVQIRQSPKSCYTRSPCHPAVPLKNASIKIGTGT